MNSKYCTISISLLISLLIYIFYRTPDTVINQIVLSLFNEELYWVARQYIQHTFPLPESFIYSLPEGLWILSLTLSSMPFFIAFKSVRIPLIIFPPIVAISFEVMQYLHITNGRFDVLDIVYSLLFWSLSFFWHKKSSNRINLFVSKSYATVVCATNYVIVYFAHVLD